MGFSKYIDRVKQDDPKLTLLQRGPFKGHTCFVHTPSRIDVNVQLGFQISSVQTFTITGLSDEVYATKGIQGCMVVLIGGQDLILHDVCTAPSNVWSARLCVNVPKGADDSYGIVHDYLHKKWLDVGDYLSKLAQEGKLHPDSVKSDLSRMRIISKGL